MATADQHKATFVGAKAANVTDPAPRATVAAAPLPPPPAMSTTVAAPSTPASTVRGSLQAVHPREVEIRTA